MCGLWWPPSTQSMMILNGVYEFSTSPCQDKMCVMGAVCGVEWRSSAFGERIAAACCCSCCSSLSMSVLCAWHFTMLYMCHVYWIPASHFMSMRVSVWVCEYICSVCTFTRCVCMWSSQRTLHSRCESVSWVFSQWNFIYMDGFMVLYMYVWCWFRWKHWVGLYRNAIRNGIKNISNKPKRAAIDMGKRLRAESKWKVCNAYFKTVDEEEFYWFRFSLQMCTYVHAGSASGSASTGAGVGCWFWTWTP